MSFICKNCEEAFTREIPHFTCPDCQNIYCISCVESMMSSNSVINEMLEALDEFGKETRELTKRADKRLELLSKYTNDET